MKQLYKLCQVIFFCLAFFLAAPSLLFSQKRTLTAYPNTIVDSFIHGFYTSLPASYGSSGTKKYPLLISLGGTGETGSGSASSLPVMLNVGPQKQINLQVNQGINANFPDPVVVNGQSFEFIVVAPQLNTWPWNGYEQLAVNDMINYAIRHYRVDTSKMYLTGLSMGGGITWEYAGYSGPLYAKRLAGLIPVAGASSPSRERAVEIAKEHLPVWATAYSSDPTVPTSYTVDYVNLLNQAGANPAPLITIFPKTGHGGWRETYGDAGLPGVVQNGLNIYQWMCQYKRQGDNVIIDKGTSVPPPSAGAGVDQFITLPTSSVTLTGTASDPNGTITAYQWTEVSGPSVASFSNAKAAQTTVSGLVAGTYQFKFTATSSTGQSSSDAVNINVNPATVFTVYAGPDLTVVQPVNSVKISGAAATVKGEAVATCRWTQISGPSTATIAGGGSITPTMGSLVQGTYVFQVALTSQSGKYTSDQMSLTVSPLITGTFVVNAGPDVTITLPTSSWKIAGTCTVKGVGVSSCRWKQVSGPSTAAIAGGGSITPTVSGLKAGTYVFGVDVVSTAGQVSSDQMTLKVNPVGTANEATALDATSLDLDSATGPSLKLYPNPVQADQLVAVEGQGWKNGTIRFLIYDISGRVIKQSVLENQSSYFRQTIPVSGLTKGNYVLAVAMEGEKTRTFKLIIQ